jgi:ADP-ribose pyrophosphatase YjhB (NUDIX family)
VKDFKGPGKDRAVYDLDLTAPRKQRMTVRAFLSDADGRLVLIKRTRPGQDPYYVLPGGGVEPEDGQWEGGHALRTALARECFEELGARIAAARELFTVADDGGPQYFFAARVESMDPALRTGTEFDKPERGRYDIEHVRIGDLGEFDLRPVEARNAVLEDPSLLAA